MAADKNKKVSPLTPQECYVGQEVFWLMWVDPNERGEERKGCYGYRPNLVPEIWSAVVEKISPRKIMLEHYGKPKVGVYACEQDAVTAVYEWICTHYLSQPWGMHAWDTKPKLSLGEASVILRKLAELEFNLNTAEYRIVRVDADSKFETVSEEADED